MIFAQKIKINHILNTSYLFYDRTVLNIYNFNTDLLINNSLEFQKNIRNIVNLQNFILEKTERELVVNFNFDKIEGLENIRDIENIAFYLYKYSLSTKFISAKNLIVSFPQIFENKIIQSKYNNYEEDVFNFNCCFSFDKITQDFQKKETNYFIESFDTKENINEEIIKIFTKIKFDENPIYSHQYMPINKFKFKKVALGGSFDHMHSGHNLLLTTAALCCNDTLLIGLTSDEMISKKDTISSLQPFKLRELNLRNTLQKIGYNKNLEIFEINDSLGGTSKDESIDALLITEETEKGGEYVNKLRQESNIKPLNLIFSRLIENEEKSHKNKITNENQNYETKISSRKIRETIKNNCLKLDTLFKNWTEFTQNKLNFDYHKSVYWFTIIRDLYSQPWRKYHNLNHVYELLKIFEDLNKKKLITDETNFYLSIWFHDVIYVPSRKDNEERSCQIINNLIKNPNFDNSNTKLDFKKINDYIIHTKSHIIDQSNFILENDMKLFLDSDMAILGQKENKYFTYVGLLREEYFEYPEEQWVRGRTHFIEKLLERKKIFYTDYFSDQYEKQAKENLKLELDGLICRI